MKTRANVVSRVTNLQPEDTEQTPFFYTFKVQCTSCREVHPNWVSISRFVCSSTYERVVDRTAYVRHRRPTSNPVAEAKPISSGNVRTVRSASDHQYVHIHYLVAKVFTEGAYCQYIGRTKIVRTTKSSKASEHPHDRLQRSRILGVQTRCMLRIFGVWSG